MSYEPGEPITGFSIDMDGDPEAIERIARKIVRAMRDEIDLAYREENLLLRNLFDQRHYVIPRMPFQGTIRLRTRS